MLSIEVTANSQTKNILESLDDNAIVVNISSTDSENSITINAALNGDEPLKLRDLYSQYQGQEISTINVKNGSITLLTLNEPVITWTMSYSITRLTEQINITKNIK